jgi:hypothetical protein
MISISYLIFLLDFPENKFTIETNEAIYTDSDLVGLNYHGGKNGRTNRKIFKITGCPGTISSLPQHMVERRKNWKIPKASETFAKNFSMDGNRYK